MARAKPQRVVVQYAFKGYTPPQEALEAFVVECQVTHADVAVGIVEGSLVDVWAALEERGFARHGAHPLRTHCAGRWEPTWREVWTRPG